jgi:hypothetical protein
MSRLRLHRPKLLAIAVIALLSLSTGLALALLTRHQPSSPLPLHLTLPKTTTAAATTNTIITDTLRIKWSPENRADFHLSSEIETAIFIHNTAVQVLTPSGWRTENEEIRNEIWTLKPDVPHEASIEIPRTGPPWRAYIRYSPRLKGVQNLSYNLQDAWISRSFKNWNGKPWGGRYGGEHEVVSATIELPED